MASLAINQVILSNRTKPSLDQAKKYLSQARSKCNSLSIPTSFLYRNYLKNIANNLLNIEIDINASKTKIDDTISQYNRVESKTSNKVRSLTAMVSDSAYNISNTKTTQTSASFSDKVVEDIKKTASKVGNSVSNWCKGAWNWVSNVAAPKVWDILKKTGSLIAVAVQSIVAGLLEVVEAAVDLVALVGTGVASIFTGIWDGGQAIYGAITGNEWHSATKTMWKGTKSFVSTTWVRNGYNALCNTAYGKWLNENSFGDWARTDGIISQVAEGIGYVAGVMALSVVTFGTATPLVLATTAGSLAVSKYTEEAWNNNKISIDIGNGNSDMSLNYDELSTLNNEGKLKKQIEQTDELGNVITTEVTFLKNEDGSYSAVINGQKLNCNVDETGILEGLGYGGINGIWEGVQWGLGAAIGVGQFKCLTGGIKSASMQKIAVSGTRIVLDSVTGAVETPFRTLLDNWFNDMTLEEAWNKNGGWNGVLSQTLIAGIMSAGGEVFDLGKSKLFKKKQAGVESTKNHLKELLSNDEISIDDFYKKMSEQNCIDKNELPFEELKKVFTKDGIESNLNKEDILKRTLLLCGDGKGKSSKKLFKEFGLSKDNPISGSLNTLEARVWYLEGEKDIPKKLTKIKKLNTTLSLEDQARFCFNERNRLREVSRDAMQDIDMAKYLRETETHRSFEQFVDKKRISMIAKNKKFDDDSIYRDIIDSSSRHRTMLDKCLGIGDD